MHAMFAIVMKNVLIEIVIKVYFKKVFNKLDVDKNGRLSMQDLRNGLLSEDTTRNSFTSNRSDKSISYNNVLDKCDFDGDGKLDFGEFIQAAVCQSTIINKESVEMIFKLFDLTGDK